MEEKPKFLKILDRATYHLNRVSRSQNNRERLYELIEDEAKFYRSAEKWIREKTVPLIDLENTASIEEQRAALMALKHEIENKMGKISLHMAFLHKKITDLKYTPVTFIVDVYGSEISQTYNQLEGYEALFTRILTAYDRKLGMVKYNLRALKAYRPCERPQVCS